MTMNRSGTKSNLLDAEIWIIDDDIPVQLYKREKDKLITGEVPIDQGTLISILHEDGWEDEAVKKLTQELTKKARNTVAFTNPSHALEQLQRGAKIPDGIIFDLSYRNQDKNKTLEQLVALMNSCMTVVQVYTRESVETAKSELEDLPEQIQIRLEKPLNKSETDAAKLGVVVKERIEKSLSAKFASELRRLTSNSIETVLVKLDSLPLSAALTLLTGEYDVPKQQEFVELVAEKVGDDLTHSNKLAEAIKKYGKDLGVKEEKIEKLIGNLTSLLKAHVQNYILEDAEFEKRVAESWEIAQQQNAEGPPKISNEIIRGFEAFRMYSKPTDDYVRTGDIVLNNDLVYMVLTPLCDLERFWKKTRGSLTILKMHPLVKEKGIGRARSYGNNNFLSNGVSTIASRHPFILPSVPISVDKYGDYAIFAYEVKTQDFINEAFQTKTSRQMKAIPPLSYSELLDFSRLCKLSEPYLNGLLGAVRRTLFRVGLPQFASEEQDRVKGLFEQD